MKRKQNQLMKRLKILKQKMVTAKEFDQVFDYFFDHFGESETFMDIGKPTRHQLLESVVTQAAKQILRTKTVKITQTHFFHLPKQQFIHGSCDLSGYIVSLFYFEDIDVGMLAMTALPLTSETQIVRFSCHQLPKRQTTWVN